MSEPVYRAVPVEQGAAPPPPRKTPVGPILGVGCVVLLGIGIGSVLLIRGIKQAAEGFEPRAASTADREVLLTTDDLAPWLEGTVFDPQHETVSRSGFAGTLELEYEYETPGDEGIYLASSLNVERTATDARRVYVGMQGGLKVGFLLAGEPEVDYEDRNDLLSWGDDSRSVLITHAGDPGGNFFIARRDNRVFYVMIAGVYFDDPEAFAALMVPVLEAMDAHPVE